MEIYINKSVEIFIKKCSSEAIPKILRTINLLQEFGFELGMPHSKLIMKDIYELRISGKQNVRIFYTSQNRGIILFHAILKKSRGLSQKDIHTIREKFARL